MAATFSLVFGLALGAGAVWLWARTQLTGERRAAEEKLALVKEAQAGWEDRVKAVTGDALTKSQSSLLQLTEAKLAPTPPIIPSTRISRTMIEAPVARRAPEDRRKKTVMDSSVMLRCS